MKFANEVDKVARKIWKKYKKILGILKKILPRFL